jgi:RNA recognition motif-containing protein
MWYTPFQCNGCTQVGARDYQIPPQTRSRLVVFRNDFMLAPSWLPIDADGHPPHNHSRKGESMNIYVGNLSYDTGNNELRSAFERYGRVDDARVAEDKNTQRSRGFGFVEMANESEARNAISQLNGTDLQGRTINVNEARPREERSTRSRY